MIGQAGLRLLNVAVVRVVIDQAICAQVERSTRSGGNILKYFAKMIYIYIAVGGYCSNYFTENQVHINKKPNIWEMSFALRTDERISKGNKGVMIVIGNSSQTLLSHSLVNCLNLIDYVFY
jgi:hypothetical protein